MGCSRGQLGSTLLGLWGTRQNVPRDVATEGWRGEGINAITLVAFGYRSPQETLNSSSCNLTRKLSEAREKVARNDVGAEWRGCCPCAGSCPLQLQVGQRGVGRGTHSSTTHKWSLTIYFYQKSGSPLWPEAIISLLPITFFMNKKQFLSFTFQSMLREK